MTGIGAPEFHNDPQVIEKIMTSRGSTWAVVGLSAKKMRPVHRIAPYIAKKMGMNIIAINPKGEDVPPFVGYKSLLDIPVNPQAGSRDIDVVDIWVNGSKAGAIIDQAIEIGAKAIWLQMGVNNPRAVKRAQKAGLDVVVGTCPHVEGERAGIDLAEAV